MKLYEYQIRFRNDPSRLRIVNKSRQIGFSFLTSVEAVDKASFMKKDVLLASASLRQSKELNFKCQKLIEACQAAGIPIELEAASKEELKIKDGGRIFTLPSNPNTVRGFSGDVYLDEFALHKDQYKIYQSLVPTITRGHSITIISTPLGQSDLFYEIFTDKDKYPDFVRYQTDIYQAKELGFDVDVELIKRNVDEETFRQEYLCEFIDENSSYFPYDLIMSCKVEDEVLENVYGMNYLGVDIGRRKDLTAIYIFTKAGTKFYYKDSCVLKGKDFNTQKDVIRQYINEYNIFRGCIDATGIGNQLAEELNQEFSFIEPVQFTNPIKERMVVDIKKLYETKNIAIPSDRELITDTHSIRKIVTMANNIRFDADSTDKGHADRFWASALAIHAGIEDPGPFEVTSARKRESFNILRGY